jgi:hypothetical protein
MGVLGSDGLRLLVGNGAFGGEVFSPLRGSELIAFEVVQQLRDSDAVRADSWNAVVGISARRLTIDGTALATDEDAAERVRSLALTGEVGNFRLNLRTGEDLFFAAAVTSYKETIQAGAIKRFEFTLESSAAATVG